jgi:predicted TIM-barrel fold metal-dependent hydrolase
VFFDESVARSVSERLVPTPEGLIADAASPRLERVAAIVIATKGELDKTRAQNEQLFALSRAHPKLFPVVSVHPDDGEAALAELERCAKLGAKMLKLHPNTQHFDVASPPVDAVVEKAATLGLPVLFDGTTLFDRAAVGKLVMLGVRHPKAKLVIAHMGFSDFRELIWLAALRVYPWFKNNVWVDLSFIPHTYVDSPYVPELLWVARQVGVERLLFGSDFPIVTSTQAIEDLERLGFSPSELRLLLHDNAKQLLGF